MKCLQPDPFGLRLEIKTRMKNIRIRRKALEELLDLLEEMLQLNPMRRVSAA